MFSEILKLSEHYLFLTTKENKVKNRMFKLAAATIDLGEPIQAGKGIAEIIKFLLKRIDPKTRPHSQYKLKEKLWHLNEYQMSNKKSPASASLGLSISFVKNILNGNPPLYIRSILKE